MHALDLVDLRDPAVTVWTGWIDDELAGVVALARLDQHHSEIESMRTATRFLRRGVAAEMLRHLLIEAAGLEHQRLSLKTGSTDPFLPARRLYASAGFEPCPPFGG